MRQAHEKPVSLSTGGPLELQTQRTCGLLLLSGDSCFLNFRTHLIPSRQSSPISLHSTRGFLCPNQQTSLCQLALRIKHRTIKSRNGSGSWPTPINQSICLVFSPSFFLPLPSPPPQIINSKKKFKRSNS